MTLTSPEDGIPVPRQAPRRRGGLADQFRKLQVGQSVLVRGREKTDGLHGYWKHLRDELGWKMKFAARKTDEGVRVWRKA